MKRNKPKASFYCIFIFILVLLPSNSRLQKVKDEPKPIYFRKCCNENEVYEYTQDKCINRKHLEFPQSRQKYPINFIHDDFSVLYVSRISNILALFILAMNLKM